MLILFPALAPLVVVHVLLFRDRFPFSLFHRPPIARCLNRALRWPRSLRAHLNYDVCLIVRYLDKAIAKLLYDLDARLTTRDAA